MSRRDPIGRRGSVHQVIHSNDKSGAGIPACTYPFRPTSLCMHISMHAKSPDYSESLERISVLAP
jgi:hypothetical protein